MRWGRHGRFNLDTARERFLLKTKQAANGCLIWIGSRSERYGSVGFKGRAQLAHRIAWILFVGEDPGDKCVCHTCDNGFCVNVEHLFLGSQGDNVRDMESKGRSCHPFGENHGRSKLTAEDVATIRSLKANGMAVREIARRYPQVNRTTITAIVKGKTWRYHVKSGGPNLPS